MYVTIHLVGIRGNRMKQSTKVKNAISKAAREIPIIAWAVEADGIINPVYVYRTRSTARQLCNDLEVYGKERKVHVRKVAMYVIPGR